MSVVTWDGRDIGHVNDITLDVNAEDMSGMTYVSGMYRGCIEDRQS